MFLFSLIIRNKRKKNGNKLNYCFCLIENSWLEELQLNPSYPQFLFTVWRNLQQSMRYFPIKNSNLHSNITLSWKKFYCTCGKFEGLQNVQISKWKTQMDIINHSPYIRSSQNTLLHKNSSNKPLFYLIQQQNN